MFRPKVEGSPATMSSADVSAVEISPLPKTNFRQNSSARGIVRLKPSCFKRSGISFPSEPKSSSSQTHVAASPATSKSAKRLSRSFSAAAMARAVSGRSLRLSSPSSASSSSTLKVSLSMVRALVSSASHWSSILRSPSIRVPLIVRIPSASSRIHALVQAMRRTTQRSMVTESANLTLPSVTYSKRLSLLPR